MKKYTKRGVAILSICLFLGYSAAAQLKYPIVDTGVKTFYSNNSVISAPNKGDAFYGQDATYTGNQPSYTDNGDGTITDNVTGLMWEKDMGEKMTLEEAVEKAKNSTLGGYNDWRVPTIKELYSLIQFTGQVKGAKANKLFIDTNYFNQQRKRTANTMYFRMVRGNTDYGKNNFIDNGDGTVSDYATGLMWQKADDGIARDWEAALAYSENLELAGYSDWRLPNAKELQSIVDYSRSPQTTNSPAIDPIFSTTEIKDPEGNAGQYPYFWTGTTHLDGVNPASGAVYVAFGEGQGKMRNQLMDVHGAGCQRSDPKSENNKQYPIFFGPQGDVRYVYNYVRSVRTIKM